MVELGAVFYYCISMHLATRWVYMVNVFFYVRYINFVGVCGNIVMERVLLKIVGG